MNTMTSALSRRRLLSAIPLAALAGCDNIRALQPVKTLISGYSDIPLSREAVIKLPYGQISAKLGKGPRSLLILAAKQGDDLHWASADRAVLVTRAGRLVTTVGLPVDLRNTRDIDTDPLASGLHRLGQVISARRLCDIGRTFNCVVEAEYRVLGRENLTVVELTFDTVVVETRERVAVLDWEFSNRYWADAATGVIWKSIQHVAPKLPAFDIELLKPAA